MHDIIFISNRTPEDNTRFLQFKSRFPLAKHASTYDEAKSKSFTQLFWLVWSDVEILPTFKFEFDMPEWDRKYIYVFDHADSFRICGVCLSSKDTNVSNKEFTHRFFLNKKEIDIKASARRRYDIFRVDTYDEYRHALATSTTDMFWITSRKLSVLPDFKFDLVFDENNTYDRFENHAFIHREDGKDTFDGIFLLSKHKPVSKKEIDYRFLVNRKEWNIIASGPPTYEKYTLSTYAEYLSVLKSCSTELFWNVPADVNVDPNFKFDLYFGQKDDTLIYDRKINHVFLNGDHYDGIALFSTHTPITQREFTNRFLVVKKEWEVVASTPKPYDIVFISYNEPTADENFAKLLTRFPRAKRIHGVTGIHQAHIAAAKHATTDMFWVVDADAIIDNGFNFDFEYIPFYNLQARRILHSIVHVWQSKNPLNDLVYGYGGVKLLPRELAIKMDVTKPDMTTSSISSEFKAMPTISNLTAFNTDPFNTWKSAFRECVKLSSRAIEGQINSETQSRLDVWCTVASGDYSDFAIAGALAGRKYGQENAGNIPAISLINDFTWLRVQFETSFDAIGNTVAITSAQALATS